MAIAISTAILVSQLCAAERRPNIVFILADDLGYTDLGCTGSGYYETPNIDRLAADGVLFKQGYTCGPNCQPTRAALLSGQYGPRTGVYTVGSIDRFDWQSRPLKPVDNVTSLPLDKVTLADALRAAGYATGMFGKWHLVNDPEHHPSKRGFDEPISSAGRHFNFATDPDTAHDKDAYLADFLTDRAVDFIARHKDRPFFLYLPHFAVHTPLEAKEDLIAHFRDKPASGGHNNPVYAAMTASLDQSVGRVLKSLDEHGLAENTLVIFSSDNGGVGGYQREGIQANENTDNAPLRGGKGMLYEGGVHVPYIFRWKGKIPAGATCRVPINSVDLYPTLLEVTGAEKPAGHTLDGHSYAAYLTASDAAAADREPIYWHFPGYLGAGNNTWRTTPAGAVRSGDWKLIEFFEDGRVELFNMADDPGERHDRAGDMPDRARQLRDQLALWRKSVKAPMPKQNDDRLAPAKKRREGRNRKGQSTGANDG